MEGQGVGGASAWNVCSLELTCLGSFSQRLASAQTTSAASVWSHTRRRLRWATCTFNIFQLYSMRTKTGYAQSSSLSTFLSPGPDSLVTSSVEVLASMTDIGLHRPLVFCQSLHAEILSTLSRTQTNDEMVSPRFSLLCTVRSQLLFEPRTASEAKRTPQRCSLQALGPQP